jgi:hypothetical protein
MTAATASSTTSTHPAAVGTLIDKMWALREEKKRLEAETVEVSKQMSAIEETIVERMDAEGLTKSAGKNATVSFSFSVTADVQGDEGWKLLYAYIKKTGYFHLLHRRVTDTAYKELLDAGKKVPGVLPFTKKRVNLRTISS